MKIDLDPQTNLIPYNRERRLWSNSCGRRRR